MTPVSEAFPRPTERIRVVYSDLDGTMVGPGGCFFRGEDQAVTLEPARALASLLEAGITLVLVSGRTQAQLLEACGIFGADGYVAELGAMVGWNRGRERHLCAGPCPITSTRYPTRSPRRCSSATQVSSSFTTHGTSGTSSTSCCEGRWIRWRSTPGSPRKALIGYECTTTESCRRGRLPGSSWRELHVYHLVPEGIDKGQAVGYDLARRGLLREQAIAIGDSASDLLMAPQVGRFHLVANGARSAPVRALAEAAGNAVIEQGSVGAGWSSAVRAAVAAEQA